MGRLSGIHLREGELAYLIRESVGKTPVDMSFGPSGVFTNENTPKWCLEMIARMRFETNEDGGGI